MKRVVQIVYNEDHALLKFVRLTVLYAEPSDSLTGSRVCERHKVLIRLAT